MSTPTTPVPPPSAHGRTVRKNPIGASWLAAFLLLLALVLGNVLLSRTVVRADLTEEHLYTLSPATRSVVGGLTDPLRIRVYWGDKVPGTAAPVRRRLEGLLEEYETASDGKVQVTWVKMDASGQKDAEEKGIPEETFFEISANERKAAKDRAGLAILYEDKTELVPDLIQLSHDQSGYQLGSGVEYMLTSRIYKMSRAKKLLIGLVTDAQPPKFDFMHRQQGGGGDKFTVLAELLESYYGNDLRRSVNLDDAVAPDIGVLVVAAPRDWSEKKAYHLEQFVLRGGKALILADAVDIEIAMSAQPAKKTGLEDWLKAQGVEIAPGVLAELDPELQGGIVLQDGRVAGYPYFVFLRGENMDRTNAALAGISRVALYYASELVVDAKANEAAGRTVTTLATTGPTAVRKPDTTGLRTIETPTGTPGKRAVMVSLQGKFTSAWKGKTAPDAPPPEPSKPETPDAAMADAPPPDAAMTDEPPPGAMSETPPAPPAMDDAAMGEAPPGGRAEDGQAPAPPSPAPGMAEPAPSAPVPPAPSMDDPPMGEPAPSGPRGPEGEGGDKPDGKPGEKDGEKKDEKAARLDEGSGTVVLLGDAELVSDSFSGIPGRDLMQGATQVFNKTAGFVLVPNVIDWMTGSDQLMGLRARTAGVRKLEEITTEKADAIRLANLLGAPVLLLILGLVVYFVRKHRS